MTSAASSGSRALNQTWRSFMGRVKIILACSRASSSAKNRPASTAESFLKLFTCSSGDNSSQIERSSFRVSVDSVLSITSTANANGGPERLLRKGEVRKGKDPFQPTVLRTKLAVFHAQLSRSTR